jgi:hypothetical protein
MSELEWLDLSETAVSDESVTKLVQLRSLRKLDLWDTQVTLEGQAKLQRALPGCAIAR